MNRTIKFRAWDKDKKRFWSQEEMTKIGGFYYCYGVEPEPDEFDLMQFTGLLDAKGKEIYEGDIVDGTLDVGMENGCTEDFRAPVVWSDMGYWDIGAPASEVEIIGNIHENPELLTT